VRLSILCLGLVALLLAGCSPEDLERLPAPDFAHPDLSGQEVRLSELRGKTVVIDFWATWCAPCVYQPAQFNAFLEAYEGDDVVVLGVEIGGASVEEIRAWSEENDAVPRYPVLVGAEESLPHRYGVVGYPAMIVVDPAGDIALIHHGVSEAEAVEDAIEASRS
jgi:peroxiredoxin